MAYSEKGLNFARGILEKYGWKEGRGLGRKENGIVHALKPTLKFDNAGIGHSGISEQFTSRWWEQAYNNIAKNITVEKSQENICVKRKSTEDTLKCRHARPPIAKYDTRSYDSFIKKSVLTKEGSVQMSEPLTSQDDISKEYASAISPVTDEEIFWACGGRTVHKGARHGLKLNGKLARIQRQENEYLQKFQTTKNSSHKHNDADAASLSKEKKGNTQEIGRENKTGLQVQWNSRSDLPVSEKIRATKKNKKIRKPNVNEKLNVFKKKEGDTKDKYSVSNVITDCTLPFASDSCNGELTSVKTLNKSKVPSLVEDASCPVLTQCLENGYNEAKRSNLKKMSKRKKRLQNSEDSRVMTEQTARSSYSCTMLSTRYENSEPESSKSSKKKLKRRQHSPC